jgi:hypothetical protein
MKRGVRDSRPAHDDERHCINLFSLDFFITPKMKRIRADSSQLPIHRLHGAIIACCVNRADIVFPVGYELPTTLWRFSTGKRIYHAPPVTYADPNKNGFRYLFMNC